MRGSLRSSLGYYGGSFELLINEGIKTAEQILTDLALNAAEVESLACLEHGYLSGQAPDVVAMPQLHDELRAKTGTGNVIRFAPKR